MTKSEELKAMLAGVNRMAVEMKKKLRAKAAEGYQGGLERNNRYRVAKKLQEHVVRLTGVCPHCDVSDGEHDDEEGARQAVDVCNLALMLWLLEGGADG